jgi:hypothetical protein
MSVPQNDVSDSIYGSPKLPPQAAHKQFCHLHHLTLPLALAFLIGHWMNSLARRAQCDLPEEVKICLNFSWHFYHAKLGNAGNQEEEKQALNA